MERHSTRTKMVNAAIDLFHQKGVNATSVDDVLKHSGTGKSQFTHYFKTKAGLVQAAVRQLSQMIQEGHAVTSYEIKTWKQMEKWFQTYIDFQSSIDYERSCPVGTIGNDLTENVPETREDVIAFLEWARNELTTFFLQKIAAEELPKSTNARRLADLCITTMQGGMLLTKIRRDPEMFSNAAAEVLSYIKHLRLQARDSKR